MAITILPGALTTLATLKSAMEITVSTYDDLLKLAINGATKGIEGYCDRVFARDDIVDERHTSSGGVRICVKRPPILDDLEDIVVEYEEATSPIGTDNLILESARNGILFVKGGLAHHGLVRSGIAQDLQPGTEPPSLLVTYEGGFVTPQQAEAGGEYALQAVTLPDDIQIAAIRYAGELFSNMRAAAGGEIASESLDGASVTYVQSSPVDDDGNPAPLPPHIAGMVRRYKRLRFV